MTLLFLAVLVGVAAPAADARRFSLDDFERLVRLEEPQLSPDGRQVALLVGRANLGENRYDVELVLVDAKSGAQRRLVSGRPGLASPRFAAAGDRLAFLADSPTPGARTGRGSRSSGRTRWPRARAPCASTTPSRSATGATSSAARPRTSTW